MQPAGSLRRTRVVPSANRAPIAVLSRRGSSGQRAGRTSAERVSNDEESCLPPARVTEADIRDWCIAYLQKTVDNPSIAIGPEANFAELGLDSATSAYFIVELEEWLGAELRPEL